MIEPIKKPKSTEINAQIMTKPNRRILGIVRFHVRAHSLGTTKRNPEKNEEKKWRKFLREKVGEPPVIFDSSQADKSARNIKQLMFNKGYFDSKVSYTVKFKGKRRRRAFVTYLIEPKEYYTVKSNNLLVSEFEVDSILEANKKQSLIKVGDQMDFTNLTNERARIDNLLKNTGYFYFGKEYIEFDLDTQNLQVDVETVILTPENGDYHLRVRVDTIKVIFPSIDAYKLRKNGTEYYDSVYFTMEGYPLDKELLIKQIQFRQGQLYSKDKTEKSYSRLSELKLFKSVDIVYHASKKDSSKWIDAYIYLSPLKKQEYTIEPQGVVSYDIQSLAQINQNRSFGVGNAITYTNRNLFGKAEQFNISSITSFQAQVGGRSNTIFEQSINTRLNLPGSRLLSALDNNPKVLSYSTQINLSYVYQRNPDYKRNILPANFSYFISKKRSNNWLLTPIEINYNRSTVSPEFFNRLTDEQKKFISVLFARNLILSSHVTYFTNRISKKNPKKRWYLKSNVLELGGNSLYAFSRIFNTGQDSLGTYNVFGVPFSQYVRTDIDIRLTHKMDINNTFVYRINTGIALPYGNRDFLPVDKRYFIGGANSLRGWNPRAMGPGNRRDTGNTISLDRTAEMLILANMEYRFAVIGQKLEMALFLDAGNVWNVVEGNSDLEKFKLNQLFQSTALNTGLGFRFDFQFFLFRLDWGIRMHNPSLDRGERWIIQDFFKPNFITQQTLLNIGLGYPF